LVGELRPDCKPEELDKKLENVFDGKQTIKGGLFPISI
jgi:hypothetical protein